MNTYTTHIATQQDIPGILAILKENLLVNKSQLATEDIENSGFLIMNHPKEDLEKWIADKENHIVLVCKNNQEIVGYILGCNLQELTQDMQEQFAEIPALQKMIESQPVLYHKQIGVKRDSKGVGSALLQAFFETAANKYQYIVCLIVHEPVFNKISVNFHQKYGFECVGDFVLEGTKDGVYLKIL